MGLPLTPDKHCLERSKEDRPCCPSRLQQAVCTCRWQAGMLVQRLRLGSPASRAVTAGALAAQRARSCSCSGDVQLQLTQLASNQSKELLKDRWACMPSPVTPPSYTVELHDTAAIRCSAAWLHHETAMQLVHIAQVLVVKHLAEHTHEAARSGPVSSAVRPSHSPQQQQPQHSVGVAAWLHRDSACAASPSRSGPPRRAPCRGHARQRPQAPARLRGAWSLRDPPTSPGAAA